MSIKNYKMIIKKFVFKFIYNPNFYIAALIGGLVGLVVGGGVGALSGGFIAYNLQFLGSCVTLSWGIDPNIILGIIVGIEIGAGIGAVIIALLTISKIYKDTQSFSVLLNKNTQEILLHSLGFSFELATGMAVGAIIFSLKSPGYGTIVGAFIGLIIMLLKSIFKSLIK